MHVLRYIVLTREGIFRENPFYVVLRADHHADVFARHLLNDRLDLFAKRRLRRLAGIKGYIAAVDIGDNILKPQRLERRLKLSHLDHVAARDVDAAGQGYVSHINSLRMITHWIEISSPTGTRMHSSPA